MLRICNMTLFLIMIYVGVTIQIVIVVEDVTHKEGEKTYGKRSN